MLLFFTKKASVEQSSKLWLFPRIIKIFHKVSATNSVNFSLFTHKTCSIADVLQKEFMEF